MHDVVYLQAAETGSGKTGVSFLFPAVVM